MATLSTENTKRRPSISEELWEAHRLVEAGQLQAALADVKQIKALEPRNIYVLAFEKQLEQLIEYTEANILTDEQRADIIESIPGIIERAIDGVAVQKLTAERAQSAPAAPTIRDDKAAALEWLKDQYFQHAHEYVQKEEYGHALAEIRRVYIIDPSNTTAKEFEQRIEYLANLTSKGTPPAPPAPPTLRLVTKESLANEERAALPELTHIEPVVSPTDEQESVPLKTEEWSSPPISVQGEPAHEEPPVKKRTLRPAVTIVLLLAIIAAGTTIYLLWMQNQIAKRSEQRRPTVISNVQPETFIGAPTTAGEQSYVVSPGSQETDNSSPQVAQENPSTTETPELKPPENVSSKKASRSSRAVEKPKAPSSKGKNEQKAAALPAPSQSEAKPTAQPTEPSPGASTNSEGSSTSTPVLEKEAQIIKLERPRFSDVAFEAGLSGQVSIQVQIDAEGKPLQTRILKATNQLLVAPVAEAVMKSQFSPAQLSSGPVASWMTIPFKFASK